MLPGAIPSNSSLTATLNVSPGLSPSAPARRRLGGVERLLHRRVRLRRNLLHRRVADLDLEAAVDRARPVGRLAGGHQVERQPVVVDELVGQRLEPDDGRRRLLPVGRHDRRQVDAGRREPVGRRLGGVAQGQRQGHGERLARRRGAAPPPVHRHRQLDGAVFRHRHDHLVGGVLRLDGDGGRRGQRVGVGHCKARRGFLGGVAHRSRVRRHRHRVFRPVPVVAGGRDLCRERRRGAVEPARYLGAGRHAVRVEPILAVVDLQRQRLALVHVRGVRANHHVERRALPGGRRAGHEGQDVRLGLVVFEGHGLPGLVAGLAAGRDGEPAARGTYRQHDGLVLGVGVVDRLQRDGSADFVRDGAARRVRGEVERRRSRVQDDVRALAGRAVLAVGLHANGDGDGGNRRGAVGDARLEGHGYRGARSLGHPLGHLHLQAVVVERVVRGELRRCFSAPQGEDDGKQHRPPRVVAFTVQEPHASGIGANAANLHTISRFFVTKPRRFYDKHHM